MPGVTGMALSGNGRTAEFTITAKDSPFDRLRAFHHREAPLLKAPDSLTDDILCPLGDTEESTMIPLRETVTSVTLRSATTDTAYARQVYYGFSLENGNRGILFHSMGINGNTFTAMNRNPQIVRQAVPLQPELIILSLGTNDSYGRNFDEAAVGAQVEKLIGLLKEYFPKLRAVRIIVVDKRLANIDSNDLASRPIAATIPATVADCHLRIQNADITPAYIIPATTPASASPRREVLSVKTNVLFDFAYMPGYDRFCPIPNVALEYYPLHGHFTYGASFDCPWWQHYDEHKYFQVRNYQLHTRYYLRSGDIRKRKPGEGAAFRGLYLSLYAHAYLYNICFDEKRGWEGEGWGAGLGIGYVVPLGRSGHWKLEFGLQAGYLSTNYDPYQWKCPVDPDTDKEQYYYKWYGDAKDFQKRQHRFSWLGPTRVEITLSYDLLYRRNNKKGVSFRNRETTINY